MKRKAFWYGFILLVIVQLLSPWMVNVSPSQITLEKNIARADTKRTKIGQPFAFIVVTGINDKQNISVSLFTDRNYKINYIDKIEFIRDEFTYIEKGCPAKDLTLVSKPDLSQPIKNSFAHVDNPSTNNRGYLKQDFIFPIPNTFTAECIDNSAGFDAYGHYKFTYEVEDINGKKSIRSEDTTTGESVEDLADTIGGVLKHIKDELIYIKAQTDTGNNFNVEWGVISEKKWDPVMLSSQNLVGNLKVQGDSSQTITNLSTDLSKQVQNNIKIKFLQLNKELDLYAVNRTEPFDSKKILPNSKGQYQLTASILFRDLTTTFEPKTTTGVHSSWAALSTNTKQSSKNAFTVGDYVMENYEAKNWTPGIKDGKIVLDIDISMVISAKNSEKFEPWEDIDKDGKASNKDLPGDDWENFTLDFAKPDIDTRSAKDGHGFYLLYSDSEKNDDPTIGGKDVYEVNLNEYIFGTKIPYNPIISEGKTGMTFGIEPIPVETEKTYSFKLFVRQHDRYSANEEAYTPVKSFTVPKDVTQQARGAGVLEAGNDAGDINSGWLPACSLGLVDGEKGSLPGCAIEAFYYLIFEPSSAFLAFAGYVLDKVLIYSISPGVYKVGYIVDGWRFVRDVCNLFFIFMLIYLAFKVILNTGHGTKKLIVNTIIIATVINFSYPLTTIIIDVSNITARQLYYNAFTQKDTASGEPLGLSSTAVSGYNPQAMILDSVQNSGLDPNTNRGPIFIVLLMGVIFNIIAMFLFLKIALQFIYRILGLVFAIILSPIALFSYSIEEEQRKKLSMIGFDQWLSGLLQDCFKAPVFLFLILIMTLFIKNNPFKNSLSAGVNGLDWWMSIIIPFMLIMGFLMIIESTTKKMSSSIAELAGAKVMQGLGAVAGIAMGGVALAGTGILGKAATKFAGSSMGQRIMDNAAKGGKFAELQAKLLRKAQSGSYDLRQTRLGNAVSKETGADFNLGASMIGLGTGAMVGGYMGQVERRNKKRDEFVQMLEWNKNLAQEILDKKNAKEEEKKKAEEEGKVLRDEADARERTLRDSEKDKKDADERFSDIEKLEDLLARRNDAIESGKPINEIDIQIGRIEAKLGATAGSLYDRTIDPATGRETVSKNTAFGALQTAAQTNKDNATESRDRAKGELDVAKDNIKTNEQAIRQLDKDINDLTKAIENIKKNRKNMYAHKIRNKSGYLFNKYTYGQRKQVDAHGHASNRSMNAVEQANHDRVFGNRAGEMENILTSVDEHSHVASNAQLAKLSLINASIGALAGAFTGGLGALAVGAVSGGLIGAIRSVSPGNEHYGVPHDKDEWAPTFH